MIRYTSHPNQQITAHALLKNYTSRTTPEAVFINMNISTGKNSTEEKIVKYSLDKIVSTLEEEAPLEKTVSFQE